MTQTNKPPLTPDAQEGTTASLRPHRGREQGQESHGWQVGGCKGAEAHTERLRGKDEPI